MCEIMLEFFLRFSVPLVHSSGSLFYDFENFTSDD
jgi:hypothetical protein